MSGRYKRLFRKGEILELEVTDVAFGGKGIARVPTEEGDFTVFVQNAFPGQKVKARVVKCKRRFAECKLDEILKSAPEEVQQPYQRIPGAPYSEVPIEVQRKFKRETTFDLFRRIGKVNNVEDLFDEYIESPRVWHYRNKMEYSFSEIRWDLEENKEYDDFGLGFKHRGTWWCVENLDADSGLFDAQWENGMKLFRKHLEQTGHPAWHPPKREGFYRFLVARKSFSQDEILINLVTSSSHLEEFDLQAVQSVLQEILGDRLAGFVHTINDDRSERVEPREGKPKLIWGKDHVVETIHGLEFEIGLFSFFQTNPASAEKLYARAIDYATENMQDDHVFMDLFCGTGTITQLLAQKVDTEVVGVDIVESAILDARKSAERNGVKNAKFIAADAGKFLFEHPEYAGRIHTVMLDPPRGGIAPKTLRKVIRLGAREIIYISCNPATQARDTEILNEAGYALEKLSLCDQFPHTAHVETVGRFVKQIS
ncbi:MAG: 23S rRNA (uracil(1939)-C(5))-methyltransferase RlmD [Flavobacteriales bacterium]|nr:23S rRNA (uracil(1939)-C(5))-methyltransferase RlmD [Flavobacteriales bacterium]